jgi:hypothetical protein
MTNAFFGNIGDVWKHLALAELLERERPTNYWESHAGAAEYANVDEEKARDLGVHHFLSHLEGSSLADTTYARLLQDRLDDSGRLRSYPGSAAIALSLLGDRARYVLCDSDSGSTETLNRMTRSSGLQERAVCIDGDGVGSLAALAAGCPSEQAEWTVALIDPFEPFEPTASRRDPLDLFLLLASRGVRSLLWHPDELPKYEGIATANVRAALLAKGFEPDGPAVWWGVVRVDRTGRRDDELTASGLVAANFPAESTAAVSRLGEELAALYPGGRLTTWPDTAVE